MAEWTDEEVYAKLASLSQPLEGQHVLTLTDIEAVVFDPRFPKHLKPLASGLFQRLTSMTIKKG